MKKGINKFCIGCSHKCKQFDYVIVVYCPMRVKQEKLKEILDVDKS